LTGPAQLAKSGASIAAPLKESTVAKAELGTKRICPTTGRKFYDLNKTPVISPYSGEVVPIAPVARTRAEPVAARAPVAPVAEAEPEAAEAAELVSLEEADAETEGAKKAPVADADDVEVAEDDEAADDTTFLEPDEDEGEDDVADIIGGDIADEEET
jgi:uncharacterized protein (TIGR02300 family)